jgi:hypothetical protein
MPKNEKILGKYSNQKNRDDSVHVYKLAEELSPEVCLDLKITYVNDEVFKDETDIHVLAKTDAVNCIFMFGSSINASDLVPDFIFGDTFGNAGKGSIDFSTDPIRMKLETTDVSDECTSVYYNEYELYRVNES